MLCPDDNAAARIPADAGCLNAYLITRAAACGGNSACHDVTCCRLQVNYWLGALIADRGDDLYRMKGVIAIRDFPDTFVFQVRDKLLFC